ncbi:TetR/AcrR family transcriptional regulator [Pseudonocardia halophobica]|uniref:TetR family transcriptional regulator n=1 Tax=Pseudonocardia halophobica TaxID=29401 RepID=A0A9W6NWJ0_9PSEU|nr:TetR family transcriptional regulator [Pseudonocardia halophobica]
MKPYHHGDLRRTLLASAVEVIAERGVAALSLRDLARRAGVSHAAPTHHFTDKTGLLTAVAAEGWALLAGALAAHATDFAEAGVAYVVFAVGHPAHFAVMRSPDLVRVDDPELAEARGRAAAVLEGEGRDRTRRLAAWSLVHGLAALVLEGNVTPGPDQDVAALAREVTAQLRPDDVAGQPGS